MRVHTGRTRRTLDLGPDTLLSSGGEATIHDAAALAGPAQVAKIYRHPTPERAAKLAVMLAAPPEDPQRSARHCSLTWPTDVLHDDAGTVVGYLMRRVFRAAPLIDFFNPLQRIRAHPHCNYLYLHRLARNFALTVAAVHDRQYAIGDINESNVLGHTTALVTLVDTDSFQIVDRGAGRSFRCLVGKPEFTPPELQGIPFAEVDRTPHHDRFGMAVLIFQLLMEGTHPFAGIWQSAGEPPNIADRIRRGHSPYLPTGKPNVLPMPAAPSYNLLTPELRRLLEDALDPANAGRRPDARLWVSALATAEQALKTCAISPDHRFGEHLDNCPWCERRSRMQGIDPFPGPGAPLPDALLARPQPTPQVVRGSGSTFTVLSSPPPSSTAALNRLGQGAPAATPSVPIGRPGTCIPQFFYTRRMGILTSMTIAAFFGTCAGGPPPPDASHLGRFIILGLGLAALHFSSSPTRMPSYIGMLVGTALFRGILPATFATADEASMVLVGAGLILISVFSQLLYTDTLHVDTADRAIVIKTTVYGHAYIDETVSRPEVDAVFVDCTRTWAGTPQYLVRMILPPGIIVTADKVYDAVSAANDAGLSLARTFYATFHDGAPDRVHHMMRRDWVIRLERAGCAYLLLRALYWPLYLPVIAIVLGVIGTLAVEFGAKTVAAAAWLADHLAGG